MRQNVYDLKHDCVCIVSTSPTAWPGNEKT